ncbi:MAG: transglycosylase SLT domain-containing protein [Bacteriovoracaceae bacterium]|nr:transglycosylase SLT domain-containing protein [Bacteriovoracaceae bacterium]
MKFLTTLIVFGLLLTNAHAKSSSFLSEKGMEKKISFWIHYFTKRDKPRFKRHMLNGKKYQRIVEKIFKKMGVPKDLFYVGLIESGYNLGIRSRASAIGPWQFLKGTAKDYGLKINRYRDERKNIYKATTAAAHYLKDLYNMFGSWDLAISAYNAGENRLLSAIRRGNTRSIPLLSRRRLLPKETQYYVPKVIAARRIYSNPSRYGFSLPRATPLSKRRLKANTTTFQNYYVARTGDHLNRISRRFGVSVKNLMSINKLKGAKIYKGQKIYLKRKSPKKRGKTYLVKRGDNLIKIAGIFRTTPSQLRVRNQLSGSRIYRGQKLYIP